MSLTENNLEELAGETLFRVYPRLEYKRWRAVFDRVKRNIVKREQEEINEWIKEELKKRNRIIREDNKRVKELKKAGKKYPKKKNPIEEFDWKDDRVINLTEENISRIFESTKTYVEYSAHKFDRPGTKRWLHKNIERVGERIVNQTKYIFEGAKTLTWSYADSDFNRTVGDSSEYFDSYYDSSLSICGHCDRALCVCFDEKNKWDKYSGKEVDERVARRIYVHNMKREVFRDGDTFEFDVCAHDELGGGAPAVSPSPAVSPAVSQKTIMSITGAMLAGFAIATLMRKT